jgi:hypothetical protein
MLLKMLGIQRSWEQRLERDRGPKPRQVFVTQSLPLAKKVREYFVKLTSSSEVTHPTEGIRNIGQEAEHSEGEDELIGQEYIKRWKSDLPEKFSELLDEHFPLFLTYNQVRLPSFSEHSISLLRG